VGPAQAQRLLEARKARQAQVDGAALIAALCAKLRTFYYPKQSLFFRSKHKRRATNKTRRSGATAGGCRELVARALETPRFRAVYVTTTRIEAKARAWINDTESGFVDIVRKYGTQLEQSGVEKYDMAGVTVSVRDGDLALVFSNGSLIELFGADDEGAINKLRGRTKHVWWIDEAQDFTWLERLYKAVISAGSTDFAGEVWLTGTPSKDCVGMFYEITRDDKEARLPGWEVHRIAVVDNPFFGCVVWKDGQWFVVDNLANETGPYPDEAAAEAAAVEIRWERTAGAAIEENKWDENDPDLLREWYARWVKEDARYVYALHAVKEHDIVYAPQRFADDGFPDMRAALADLPGAAELRQYFTALGADLGTRDDFAFVVWAWSLKDPILYELASWKRKGLDYDEMAQYLHAVRAQLNLSLIVADAGGGGKPAVMGWSKRWVDRYQIPITEAKKSPGYKPIAIKQMNNDIRRGLIRLRRDSPLMCEWRVHRWAPLRTAEGKEVEDPKTPNHCADGALYSHMDSYHHRYRPEPAKIIPGTPEWVIREERELEESNCEQGDPYDGYASSSYR